MQNFAAGIMLTLVLANSAIAMISTMSVDAALHPAGLEVAVLPGSCPQALLLHGGSRSRQREQYPMMPPNLALSGLRGGGGAPKG